MKKFCFLIFIFFTQIVRGDFGIQNQLELHTKYQNLEFELKDVLIYGRWDGAFNLPKKWQLYLRFDLPYMWLWGKEMQVISIGDDGLIVPPEKATHTVQKKVSFREVGLADIGNRFFFVTPGLDSAQRVTIGFGSEFGFPSATDVDLGTGKYWARPMLGVKWDFPTLGVGSWLAFLAKYQFSFAGQADRSSFQILALQPVFIYALNQNWTFVTSPEIQYDIMEKNWFIPFSINITRVFTSNFSMTAAYQKGLLTDFPVFQDEVELTLRYAF